MRLSSPSVTGECSSKRRAKAPLSRAATRLMRSRSSASLSSTTRNVIRLGLRTSKTPRSSPNRRRFPGSGDHVHGLDQPEARAVQLEADAAFAVRAGRDLHRGAILLEGHHQGSGERLAFVE